MDCASSSEPYGRERHTSFDALDSTRSRKQSMDSPNTMPFAFIDESKLRKRKASFSSSNAAVPLSIDDKKSDSKRKRTSSISSTSANRRVKRPAPIKGPPIEDEYNTPANRSLETVSHVNPFDQDMMPLSDDEAPPSQPLILTVLLPMFQRPPDGNSTDYYQKLYESLKREELCPPYYRNSTDDPRRFFVFASCQTAEQAKVAHLYMPREILEGHPATYQRYDLDIALLACALCFHPFAIWLLYDRYGKCLAARSSRQHSALAKLKCRAERIVRHDIASHWSKLCKQSLQCQLDVLRITMRMRLLVEAERVLQLVWLKTSANSMERSCAREIIGAIGLRRFKNKDKLAADKTLFCKVDSIRKEPELSKRVQGLEALEEEYESLWQTSAMAQTTQFAHYRRNRNFSRMHDVAVASGIHYCLVSALEYFFNDDMAHEEHKAEAEDLLNTLKQRGDPRWPALFLRFQHKYHRAPLKKLASVDSEAKMALDNLPIEATVVAETFVKSDRVAIEDRARTQFDDMLSVFVGHLEYIATKLKDP